MKVIWSREALADLEDIAAYYASNAAQRSPMPSDEDLRMLSSASGVRLSHRHGSHNVPKSAW